MIIIEGRRRSGQTTAICKAAKEIDAVVICANYGQASSIAREHGVITFSMNDLDSLIGKDIPVLWDHWAVYQLQLRLEKATARTFRAAAILRKIEQALKEE